MLRDDLVGQRFGRLVVLGVAGSDASAHTKWQCQCDCGKTAIVVAYSLKNGNTQSCGCLNRDVRAARFRTHGMRGTPENVSWKAARDSSERELLLVREGHFAGWVCYKHPDGQWVTLRRATVTDLLRAGVA